MPNDKTRTWLKNQLLNAAFDVADAEVAMELAGAELAVAALAAGWTSTSPPPRPMPDKLREALQRQRDTTSAAEGACAALLALARRSREP